jgi:pimeloyl-ACP methyl ester carboxylesterase
VPTIETNGVELHYEVAGSGPPLFLVHGSWGNGGVWNQAVEVLAERFRVVSYDRRGHSRSERPPGPRTRRHDEADLAGLITALAGEPAYVAANSFGGLIALGLAGRRPDLVRAVTVHEPPALSAADGGELARLADEAFAAVGEVRAEIESGSVERGTRRFIEEVALGPGAWELIPGDFRAVLMTNAPTFVAEQSDPDAMLLDVEAVRRCGRPVLLTTGDQAPRWLQLLVGRLGELIPEAGTATIAGAGHIPHETHPVEYADVLESFFRRPAAVAA